MSEIDNLRNKMDEITLEMVKLLKKRMEIAREIGSVKKNLGLGVTDENREENLRIKVISLCKELEIDEALAARFLNFLLNESVKIQEPRKQTHLSIFLKAKELEEQGKNIIHMEIGEPDFLPPKVVKTALEEVFDKGFVKYGQAKGMPKFRSALTEYIKKQFGYSTQQENVMVCPGARYAVYLAIMTLLKPGEEIIIFEPAWPAYRDCALLAGVKVRSIKTTLENKWEPSVNQIRELINQNTKMIVLNYPNNPTGKILPQNLLDDIVNIAKEHDLYVLSDEIYSEYAYDDWKSLLTYNYEKSIVTQSFSKSHAMTGFRIGYAIADSKIIEKMSKLQAICLTNVSEPIQYVAMRALEADTRPNSNNIKSKLEIVIQRAMKLKLDFVRPNGAMYVFGRVNQENFDGTKFSQSLLEHGLAIAPGEGFGEYKEFIRISACQDEKKLMEGMDILENVLRGKN